MVDKKCYQGGCATLGGYLTTLKHRGSATHIPDTTDVLTWSAAAAEAGWSFIATSGYTMKPTQPLCTSAYSIMRPCGPGPDSDGGVQSWLQPMQARVLWTLSVVVARSSCVQRVSCVLPCVGICLGRVRAHTLQQRLPQERV